MRRLGAAAVLFVGIMMALPALGYEIRGYEGKSRKATLEELAPRADLPENKTNKFFFEQYSFDMKGSKANVWFQIILSNMGVDNGKAVVLANYTPNNGDKLETSVAFDRKNWNFDVDKKKMSLKLGANSLVGDGKEWKVHLDNDKFSATIEVTPIVDPWRPGGGNVFYGKGDQVYYDITVLVPRGEFVANLTIKATGEKVEVKGLAYGDHSCWNVRPDQHARRWIKMRVVEPGFTMVISAFESTADYGSKWVGFIMIVGLKSMEATILNPVVALSSPEADAESGYMVPKGVTFTGGGLEGVIKVNKLSKRTDRLAELSEVEKLVVKNLAGVKPIEFKHNSDYEFTLDKGGKKLPFKGSRATYIYEQLLK